METSIKRRTLITAAIAAGALSSLPAFGTGSTRLIVPFPAGGGTDAIGRLLARALSDELKETVYVENIGGASGTIGTGQAARGGADGKTIVLGISATMAIAPAVYKELTYKPLADFVPLGRIGHSGTILVANVNYPANTLAELITLQKKSKEPLLYGSWGNGTGGHIAAESIRLHAGIAMQHVPYKGTASMLQDMLGGILQVGMADFAGTLPMIKAGRVKVLAITAPNRSALAPAVPTFKESGVPFDKESWNALFVSSKVAAATVETLAAAFDRAMARSDVMQTVRDMGYEPDPISRAEFERQWREDVAQWAALVKKADIHLA